MMVILLSRQHAVRGIRLPRLPYAIHRGACTRVSFECVRVHARVGETGSTARLCGAWLHEYVGMDIAAGAMAVTGLEMRVLRGGSHGVGLIEWVS